MIFKGFKVTLSLIFLVVGVSTFSFFYQTPHHKDFYLPNFQSLPKNTSHNVISVDYSKEKQQQLEKIENYIASDWRVGSLNQQNQDIYQYISDHTFKLNFLNQGQGTGWIMDFEIPQIPLTYPTIWYLATNIHVVEGIKKDDTYKTQFPRFKTEGEKTMLSISKTQISPGEEYALKMVDNNWQIQWQTQEARQGTAIDINTYDIFYHAWNFLGDRYDKNGYKIDYQDYYKDFAVLEIKFPSEELAKKATNNYFEKYYKNQDVDNKPINLFAKEWLYSDKAPSDLDNVYSAGYSNSNFDYNASMRVVNNGKIIPNDQVKTIISTPLNKQLIKGTNTYDFCFLTNKNDIVPGHIIFESDEKHKKNWGYQYMFQNSGLINGASGSMLIDENKNLLGIIKTLHGRFNLGGADVLKSEGIFDGRKIISPKFDLIRGVEGQPMSYKSQLEKFHPNMTTYLTSINWGRPQEVKTVKTSS